MPGLAPIILVCELAFQLLGRDPTARLKRRTVGALVPMAIVTLDGIRPEEAMPVVTLASTLKSRLCQES